MVKRIQHASSYLRESDTIAALLDALERNQRLLSTVRTALPSPLDTHCLHASIDGTRLTLVTDSPVWGSRLRFFAPQLETALARQYGSIRDYRVRVQPPQVHTTAEAHTKGGHGLSARAADHLMEAADGLEDRDLANALRRLATAGARRR